MNYTMLRYAFIALLTVVVMGGCASTPKAPQGTRMVERTLEVTGYCKCKQCCSWKRNWYGKAVIAKGPSKGKKKKIGVTASGTKATPGTIAADTRAYPFGTLMYIPGYGYGNVEDRGGAIKGEKIDLYFKTHKQALNWGRRKVPVKVWVRQ